MKPCSGAWGGFQALSAASLPRGKVGSSILEGSFDLGRFLWVGVEGDNLVQDGHVPRLGPWLPGQT